MDGRGRGVAWPLLLLVLAMGGFSGTVRAEPVVTVSAGAAAVPLLPRNEILDTDEALAPGQARHLLAGPDAEMITTVYSRGFVAGVVWARIVLEVAPEAAGLRYLALELPNFDRLQVFSLPADGGDPTPLFTLGDRVPPVTDIRTRFHLAPLDLPAGRTVLLVRGETNSTMTLDLKLWRLEDLLRQEQEFYALQAFYLGIVAVLGLWALGLWAFTRQGLYLAYLVAIVSCTGFWLMVNGTGTGYLWPSLAGIYLFEPQVLLCLTGVGNYGFTALFLSTMRVPRFVPLFLWGVAGISGLFTMVLLVVPGTMALSVIRLVMEWVWPTTFLTLGPMLVILRSRDSAARWLFLSWLSFNSGGILGAARNAGLVANSTFALNGPQLGMVLEMAILAYLLVSRLGRIQREKEAVQRDALAAARAHEADLEQRVADRTAELDQAVRGERAARRLQQQFVAMVSHEFRTPLAIVDAAVQNFASRDAGDRERMERILGAVRRLRRMIDNCLVDDRIDGGAIALRPDAVDLSGLLEDAVEVMGTAFERHPIRLSLPEAPVVIRADPGLLVVAIGNVLENAVKYTPEGAQVDVALTMAGDQVEVAVQDRGSGVPEAERERIFDRFYRGGGTTRSAGAGLGLFLVRSILETHGGSVRCEGGAEGGTRFVLRLPAEVTA